MYPILFRFPDAIPLLGGHALRSFSVMVLIGVLMGAWWIGRAFKEQGIDQRGAVDHLVRNALICGFIGARMLYLLVHPEAYQNLVSLIAVWQGGIVSYGGFFGGAFGAWLFARRWKIPFPRLGDAALPALFLGQVFGRIGCLLVGDDHGAPWNGPWAITFSGVEESLIPAHLVGVPLHPSQIYLSLMNLVIFLICITVGRRRRFDGQVFGVGLILYAVGRFCVEMTRGDDAARGIYGAFSTSQWVSLGTAILGVVMLIRLRHGPLTRGSTPPPHLAKAAVV
jgi:phosphatidylglycerol:prolipoprotein diacylglycerol transferase